MFSLAYRLIVEVDLLISQERAFGVFTDLSNCLQVTFEAAELISDFARLIRID